MVWRLERAFELRYLNTTAVKLSKAKFRQTNQFSERVERGLVRVERDEGVTLALASVLQIFHDSGFRDLCWKGPRLLL